jgi:type IV secretory pathway TraG/TraD family ATPase VirD4
MDYRKIGCAFLMGIMIEVGRRANTPHTVPYDLFLDEFASIAYSNFEDIVEKVRSKGIGVHLGHQSMGDLTKISPAFKTAICDSTTTKIYFRVMSKETARECADTIGTEIVDPYMVKSVKTNAGLFGGYQEAGATIKENDRAYKIHPDVITQFVKGQAAVLVS